MFESDEWDLDQDFLKDIDDKAVKFYSKTDNQEIEPKRRKIEISHNSISSPVNDIGLHEKEIIDKKIIKYDGNKESRKNLVLGIFNKNLLHENVSQIKTEHDSKQFSSNTSTKFHSDHTQSRGDNQSVRKNLVLGILANKNILNKAISNNIKGHDPQKVEAKIERDIGLNGTQGSKVPGISGTLHQISTNSYQRKDGSDSDNFKPNLIDNSRKESLSNITKSEFENNRKSKNDAIKNTSSVTKCQQNQLQPNKKMTLIRKFPGPAGLLPDNVEANIPPISYLNSLEENERTNEENKSNKLPDYCSQNTKNLFTEGAWQLMLDDLPYDFLKGYEIVTVKQIASTSGCNSTKVKFLAGIIEHIDHSHENPPIVLRDFTDNIQGIVHKDIPLKYPGLLEPNVVVLLHDVGLLKISSTFVSNKYQILISPSSLLGIYTIKGEIERACHMASVIENISKEETVKEPIGNEDYIFTKESEARSSKPNFQFKLRPSGDIQDSVHSKNSRKDINSEGIDTNFIKRVGNEKESMNFDVDPSFSISLDRITNSQNQNNFNDTTTKERTNKENKQLKFSSFLEKESTHNDGKERAENLLKSLKRFAPNVSPKTRSSSNLKNFQTGVEHPASTKQVEQKVSHDRLSEQMVIDDCVVNTSQQKAESAVKDNFSPTCNKTESARSNNALKVNREFIRSTLLQFKNVETLSPRNVESEITLNSKKNRESPETNLFNNVCYNAENDSDDEMLSQLDMDTIFSNYSKEI